MSHSGRRRVRAIGSWRAWLLTLGALAPVAGAAPHDPCGSVPPFSEDPSALLELAAESSGPGVEILRRRELYRFDEAGRAVVHRHWLWSLGAEGDGAAPEGWDAVEATWDPAFQVLESLRVRVITPGGDIFEPVPEAGKGDRSEAGGIRRALPPLAPGSVVEEEVVVRDESAFGPGWSYRHPLALTVPVSLSCLTLEAPVSLPLRYGTRGDHPLEVAQSTLPGGRTRIRFEADELIPAAVFEAGLPPDLPRGPMVVFSTGESWSKISSALSARVETAIAEMPAEELVVALGLLEAGEGLKPRFGPSREAWISRAFAALQSRVRFEPGSGTLGAPGGGALDLESTLARGSGNSLALATSLAAALRAGGVVAEVALVRRGPGQDVEPELPGLGLFDHALVYLPGRIPRWIDPSDRFSRVGQLSSALQGRRALGLGKSTSELLHTPSPRPGDNRVSVRIDVYLQAEGPARIVETSIYRGAPEHRQRRLAASLEARVRHLGYFDYLRSAYRAEELGAVEETPVDDRSQPYRLRLEALESSRGFGGDGEAAFAIILRNLITLLPRELLPPAGPRRQGRFQFQEPFVADWSFRIFPPEGLRLVELPGSDDRPLGAGRLRREAWEEDGVVHVTFRLDSGPTILEPGAFEEYRRAVENVLVEEPLLVFFAE